MIFPSPLFCSLDSLSAEARLMSRQGFKGSTSPALTHLFAKAFIEKDHGTWVVIGEKAVPFNSDFRLYVQTSQGDPPATDRGISKRKK